jgi:hypothetical protein
MAKLRMTSVVGYITRGKVEGLDALRTSSCMQQLTSSFCFVPDSQLLTLNFRRYFQISQINWLP